jgi:hypothetical protein
MISLTQIAYGSRVRRQGRSRWCRSDHAKSSRAKARLRGAAARAVSDICAERVARIAAQYGRWPHEMKAYLEEQGLLAQLRRSMREELVREFLHSKAVIEEEKA